MLFYLQGFAIWTIISIVLAIGGGITLYIIFLRSNKKFTGFLKLLHEFFNFQTLLLEEIIKISYLVLTIFLTLYSIGLIGINIGLCLLTLVVGNVALRIVYEIAILLIKICKNTTEINKKLKK